MALQGGLARRVQLQLFGGHLGPHPVEDAELAQLRIGERRLRRTPPPQNRDVPHPAPAEGRERVVGDVGPGQPLDGVDQHAGHVDGDVAVPHDHHVLRVELEDRVGEVRIAVVPPHEVEGRVTAGQVLAGNA